MARYFILIGLLALAIAASSGEASAAKPVSKRQFHGIAVFTNPPYTPSACNGTKDMGPMIAVVSDKIWHGGRACGMRFSVKCTGTVNAVVQPCRNGTVEVIVTNHCNNCTATMALSNEAFSLIADPKAGIVKISFQLIKQKA